MSPRSGYWPSRWPGEDGGPRRLQQPAAGPGPDLDAGHVHVRSREVIAATMVVLREPGEVFLLRHTAGPDAIAWVERVDPEGLDLLARSVDLPGGPTWPGGIAAHADGSLHVVFGNHAHRLDADLAVLASRELPRRRPYNSFVILPDGHLVTKDFGGVLPGDDPAAHTPEPAELVALDAGDARACRPVPAARTVDRSAFRRRRHRVRRRDLDPVAGALGRRAPHARSQLRRPVPHDQWPNLRLGRRPGAWGRLVPRQRRRRRAVRRHVGRAGYFAARRCISCGSTLRRRPSP